MKSFKTDKYLCAERIEQTKKPPKEESHHVVLW